jgi:hypothetical protein
MRAWAVKVSPSDPVDTAPDTITDPSFIDINEMSAFGLLDIYANFYSKTYDWEF